MPSNNQRRIQLFIPAPRNTRGKVEWINANDRSKHWAPRHRKTKMWRDLGYWSARAARIPKGLEKVFILAYVHKDNNAAYDPHNLMPTAKAIVDGLVDYGLIEDDHHRHLRGPLIEHGDLRKRPGITLQITPIEAGGPTP